MNVQIIYILPQSPDPSFSHSQIVATSRDTEINKVSASENYMDPMAKKVPPSVQCENPCCRSAGCYGNPEEKHLKLTGLGQGRHPKARDLGIEGF